MSRSYEGARDVCVSVCLSERVGKVLGPGRMNSSLRQIRLKGLEEWKEGQSVRWKQGQK